MIDGVPGVSREPSRGPRYPGTLPVAHGVPGHFPWPTGGAGGAAAGAAAAAGGAGAAVGRWTCRKG